MEHASVEPRDLSFHLLQEITNGFSDERKLGSGAYGKVYKMMWRVKKRFSYQHYECNYGDIVLGLGKWGQLLRGSHQGKGVHKDGKKIAVKVLYDMPQLEDSEEQFQKEFNNLVRLQHQNIVRLVGYCNEVRKQFVNYNGRHIFAERMRRALCFEFMDNGSLDNYLFDESNGHDWPTRYAIVKGICQGLKYLHEELESPLYHLDLKPANILLDANMVPKVADFGLSRLFGEEQTKVTKSPIGTRGYVPPEYIEEGIISIKFDIFSLGVVIIKMMTGRDGYFRTPEMSSEQFTELVHGNWMNRLRTSSVNAVESYSAQVKTCIQIALSCVEVNRQKRPAIGDILRKLNETEAVTQYSHALTNYPVTYMHQDRTTTVDRKEEKNEGERETKNCFGEVINNNKLNKISRNYIGKRITQEDRAREAWKLVNENDKKGMASRYLDGLKSTSGSLSTSCLVYNATGDTLYYVGDHDWRGHISSSRYPSEIGNGQWAAFHHVDRSGQLASSVRSLCGSVAAVVYRSTNVDYKDRDCLLAWSNTGGDLGSNAAYCAIDGVDSFEDWRWNYIFSDITKSGNSLIAKSDWCETGAEIATGDCPMFTAIISFRFGSMDNYD